MESKFHRFWETNKNPITMKKTDNELHIHNLSSEDKFIKEARRANKVQLDKLREKL